MKNSYETLVENSKIAIKFWWLLLIIGLAIFAMGILVFTYPTQSYLSLSMLFGWLIFFSGVSQIALFATSKHVIVGRGWMLIGGVIEVVFGLILISSLAYTISVLPLFLGFWLLFKSFNLIGFGSDMNAMKIGGGGWTIFTAILLMITSILILINPFFFGVEAVVIWVALSLLFAGISMSVFAIHLRNAHKIGE